VIVKRTYKHSIYRLVLCAPEARISYFHKMNFPKKAAAGNTLPRLFFCLFCSFVALQFCYSIFFTTLLLCSSVISSFLQLCALQFCYSIFSAALCFAVLRFSFSLLFISLS